MKRSFYLVLGLLCVVLAIVGVVLPIMPTVPFVLLAAWCFGRGHPSWEARLLAHPRYGPPIRAWRERGVISMRAKQVSALMMLTSASFSAWLIDGWLRWLPGAVMLMIILWMWTRPSK
jgi:uncharacterized membrane protein YbaN (DUF454 family)